MRKNVRKVIEAFEARKALVGDSKRTVSTDGEAIFSYAMRIAYRDENGDVQVVPVSTGPSKTTRCQIMALQVYFARCTLHEDCRAHAGLARECYEDQHRHESGPPEPVTLRSLGCDEEHDAPGYGVWNGE